jgi:Protein of unknown function (DUF3040)
MVAGGGVMALSMDEQRILDGMERQLGDDDPKLASRLASFGEPRFGVALGSGKARVVAVLLSLALAALVTLMVYSMRPFPAGGATHSRPTQDARVSTTPGSGSGSPSSQPAMVKRGGPGPMVTP